MLKSGNQSKYAAALAACLMFFIVSATGAAERYVTVPGTWNSAAPELLVKAECHLDEPEFRLVGANRREIPARVLERHGSLLRFAFNARPGERLRFIEGEKPTDPASGWQPASGVLRSIYRIKDGRANTREELEKLLDSGVPVGRTVEERVYSGWNPLAGNPRSLHLFEGVLHIVRPGTYTFYTASTDASFLEIDGRPVAAWPGRHDVWGGLRGEHSGKIELAAGTHRLTYLHANFRSSCYSIAAWQPPGGGKFAAIPESAFTPSAVAKVGPRLDGYGRKLDDFGWRLDEMLTEGDRQLYFVRVEAQPGTVIRSVDWGDGSKAGGLLAHAYFKPGDYTVTVTAGDGKTVSHAVALSYRFSQSLPKPGREAEILRTALEQERKNGLQPEGYRYLSEALRRAKLEKESKEFYETLLRRQNAIEPEVLFRHYEATRLEEQLKQEKYENAAKDLRALIGRLTAPAELGAARLALAEVEFYGLGRRKEAEAELAKIDRSALPKARVRPYEVLEMELAAAGQGKAAASALAARIDAPASRYTPRQLLALDGVKLSIRNAIVLKKFADGLRYADELEEKQPAIRLSPDYLQLRGRLEAGLGRPRAAARLLEQALLLEPDDELCAQLSLELGQFYAGRGESAAAVGSWKQAVAAAPRSHAAATAARLLNEIRNREVER